MDKHTELPWKTEGGASDDSDPRWQIFSEKAELILAVTCGGNDQANGEFIVRACNSHDALVKQLERWIKWVADSGDDTESITRFLISESKAALALAEDKT